MQEVSLKHNLHTSNMLLSPRSADPCCTARLAAKWQNCHLKKIVLYAAAPKGGEPLFKVPADISLAGNFQISFRVLCRILWAFWSISGKLQVLASSLAIKYIFPKANRKKLPPVTYIYLLPTFTPTFNIFWNRLEKKHHASDFFLIPLSFVRRRVLTHVTDFGLFSNPVHTALTARLQLSNSQHLFLTQERLMETCLIFVLLLSLSHYMRYLTFMIVGLHGFPPQQSSWGLRPTALRLSPWPPVFMVDFYSSLIGLFWDTNWPQTDTMTGPRWLFFTQAGRNCNCTKFFVCFDLLWAADGWGSLH